MRYNVTTVYLSHFLGYKVPELVSVHEGRLLAFIMTNIGFFFAFGVLYIPAHYRDRIESLLGSNATDIFPI